MGVPMGQLLHFQSMSLLMAWDRNRGWPKTLGLCTRMGNLEEALGSQLGTSPVLDIEAIWAADQQMEESLSLSLSQINK